MAGRLSRLLHRAGRFYVVLTAIAATSALCAPVRPALASPHHVLHSGHSRLAPAAAKSLRRTARGRHKQRHMQLDLSRRRPAFASRPNIRAVHHGVVPLTNTSWDNPVVPPDVLHALQMASQESGVDPHLLAAIAWRESRFDPKARSHTSSAQGLLQFTTATWLQVVRDFGAQHSVGQYSAAIRKDPSGALVVPGKDVQTAILQLRSDPILSSRLAAQSISHQRLAMQERLGRQATPADLYLLHVLGPTGAARFLTAVAQHPSASSLDVASFRVLRNAGLLARDGRPLTVRNTYAAVQVMLDEHPKNSSPTLAAAASGREAVSPGPLEISEMP